VGPFGTFSATSSRPVDKSTVIVRFDKKGVMVSVATSGPARRLSENSIVEKQFL
jgi:hypothetical protein